MTVLGPEMLPAAHARPATGGVSVHPGSGRGEQEELFNLRVGRSKTTAIYRGVPHRACT